jgi:NAD(P)H-dependent FMN reductase
LAQVGTASYSGGDGDDFGPTDPAGDGQHPNRLINTAALRSARDEAPDGVTAILYDGLAELPAFNPDEEHEPLHPAVARLRRELAESAAVLFSTPEYAGNLPGSLKNLLDWTVGNGDLYGKPVAWINVAAEGRGLGAEAALASVLDYVGAAPIGPACARLPIDRCGVGKDGTLVDHEPREQLQRILHAVVLGSAHARQLRHRIERFRAVVEWVFTEGDERTRPLVAEGVLDDLRSSDLDAKTTKRPGGFAAPLTHGPPGTVRPGETTRRAAAPSIGYRRASGGASRRRRRG